MKLATTALLVAGAHAFAPATPRRNLARHKTTARSVGVDPSHFSDFSHQVSSLHDAFTSFSLADAMDAAIPVATDQIATAQISDIADVAQDAAATDNGWFGFLTLPIEGLLQIIHSLFVAVGVAGNAWGISIIILTLLIKVVTYPLTKSQMESTNKMQAMQPAIKELQAKYQSNPEVMNQKIAEFYQTNNINPLAGCLPSFVQIPVFIGLYRAVLELAKEDKLNEPFLFLPSLEGPTYGADPASGSDWILKGWVDGAPSLGWEDTTAFLILPVLLVLSQFISMELMQPKTTDPAQQSSNFILKLLPLMIGWFSLNVPSALCVYWFTNNIITTGLSLFIKNTMKLEPPVMASGGGTARAAPPTPTIFAPPREKPAGFADFTASSSSTPVTPRDNQGVKTITAMDAEIVEDVGDDEDDGEPEGFSGDSTQPKKKRGGKRKGKKKSN